MFKGVRLLEMRILPIFASIMPKDIILFGSISQWNAMFFFDQIDRATEDDASAQLVIRVNTEGGNPEYMQAIMQKVQEISDQVTIKAGSALHSAGLFMLAYIDAENVECTDVTQALLHRAAWPEWVESASWYKGSLQEDLLLKCNKFLEKAFRARVDVAALESLPQMKEKNLTLKDIFSTDSRVEVVLTASDLKKLGLVGKIVKLTPAKSAQLKAEVDRFSKCQSLEDFRIAAKAEIKPAPEKEVETSKNSNMTIDELKAQHPALYAQVLALGRKEEEDRVAAWVEYMEIDSKAVVEALKDPSKVVNQKVMSQMQVTAMKTGALAKLATDAPGSVNTDDPTVDANKLAAQKEVNDFMAGVRTHMGRRVA